MSEETGQTEETTAAADESVEAALGKVWDENVAEDETGTETQSQDEKEEKTEENVTGNEPESETESTEITSEKQTETEETEPETTEETTTAPAVEAPAHWSLADREMFAKQTPEAQSWLMERSKAMEAAHTKRSQEIAPMRQTLEKWGPYLGQVGAAPEIAVDRLMNVEYGLRTGTQDEKRQILRELAQSYGITAPQEGETPPDPQIAELRREIQTLRGQSQQQTQSTEDQRVAQMEASVQQFAEQRTEQGDLAHPYFGEVQGYMAAFAQHEIAAGKQPELGSLYDQACWASPTVRAKLIAEQQKASADEQKQKQAEKVKQAKAASGSISGAGSGTANQQQKTPETVDDAVKAAFDQMEANAA